MTGTGFWRFRRERYRLSGVRCPHCGQPILAPRLFCTHCHHEIESVAQGVFPSVTGASLEPAKNSTVPITVLVPSYNAARTIRGTLLALLAQDLDESYEIIVVDSSSDETPQIIASEFPSVRLIHLDEQTDPGTARNLGIGQARGQVIACIDADCVAPTDWLRAMMTAQRAGHRVVGGPIENGNPESLLAWAGYLSEFREWLPVGKAHLVTHIPTCNISYHRSVFEAFGGFPTEFYPQEDLLFHWWLSHHGVPIWFEPTVCVRHVHRSIWRSYVRHLRRIGRITARVLRLTGEEGAFLARSPVLASLTVPILPLIKWLRTLDVFMNQQPHLLRRHPLALAPLLVGLYVWSLGFAEGAWAPALNSSMREVPWQAEQS